MDAPVEHSVIEHTVDCATGQAEDRPYALPLPQPPPARDTAREQALARLRARAEHNDLAADILTVLGLHSPGTDDG